MSWIEEEKSIDSISDIELVFELARRLRLSEVPFGSLESDEFYITPKGSASLEANAIGICFGHGCGYGNFAVEFYFDENGKLAGHGVWE